MQPTYVDLHLCKFCIYVHILSSFHKTVHAKPPTGAFQTDILQGNTKSHTPPHEGMSCKDG